MPGDSGSTNLFVRFKQRVDDQISQTVRAIWSLPSSSQKNNVPSPSSSNDSNELSGIDNSGNLVGGGPSSQEFATLESAVARGLRDKTVQSWVQHSAYSPLLLQYSLPQPLPKDINCGGDADREGRFTFRDAFEDLLAISSGQQLADLESRPKLLPANSLSQPPFGLFGSMRAWYDWEASLERRRLWDAYFPPESFQSKARRITTIATSDLFRSELTAEQAESFIRKYVGDAAACEEEKWWRKEQMSLGRSSPILGLLGLYGNINGEFLFGDVTRDGGDTRSMVRLIDSGAREILKETNALNGDVRRPVTKEETQRLIRLVESSVRDAMEEMSIEDGGGWRSMNKIDSRCLMRKTEATAEKLIKEFAIDKDGCSKEDANTSEDLYLNNKSDFAKPTSDKPRLWDSQLPGDDKTPTIAGLDVARRQGGAPGTNSSRPDKNSKNNVEWTEEFPEPDGGKTVKSVARRMGPWTTHETVMTTRYDAEGHVIQQMSQRQHSASKEFKWFSSSGTEEDNENVNTEEEKKSPSGKGWFWTK
ncbi:hypothetical protein PG999_003198 [Apiospora kogelbergensis]|uniref:Uncharacterized protein n=1 Tax=Apiospora kogelbergensis TaxID=1337665 RepID=A0AAW0R2Y2_9PEZI